MALQAFIDIVLRDAEMVCAELTAKDRFGKVKGVLFLGSVKYEALKKVYDTRVSASVFSNVIKTNRNT